MSILPFFRVFQRMRPAPAPRLEEAGDGQLLDLFIRRRDESAFEEIVRRHGAMVLGVCRRILHNPHDAEDCFQAAFLVLVRKAASIRPRDMVGNWLYGVAYRTALEARKMAARRRVMERKKQEMPLSAPAVDPWQELRPLLDQELSRLPNKYRSVLVLCDLEGKTRKEAARQLNVREGTVASRLARARTMLANRLARHSVAMSVATLAIVLTENAAVASVPAALASATVKAATHLATGQPTVGLISPRVAGLTERVLKSMLFAKLKVAAAVLLMLAVLGIGISAFIQPAQAEGRPDNNQEMRKPADPNQPNAVEAPKDEVPNKEKDKNQNVLKIKTLNGKIEGVVVAMKNSVVTLLCEDEIQGEGKTIQRIYNLANVAVIVNGKKAKLSDLKAKMKVTVQMSADQSVVEGVEAAGPKVDGVVKQIDPNRRAVSVDLKNMHLTAQNIPVATDASVLIDGKEGALEDVQPGMRVTLHMSAETDRSVVVALHAKR